MKAKRLLIPFLVFFLIVLSGCTSKKESGYRASDKLALTGGGEAWLERDKSIGFYAQGEDVAYSLIIDGKGAEGETVSAELLDGNGKSLQTESLSVTKGNSVRKIKSSFSAPEKNGEYRVRINLPEGELSMLFGVVDAAKKAGDQFYYGVQPYLVRAYSWENFNKTDLKNEQFTEAMLDAIAYMGCNVIREDMPWGSIQRSEGAKYNFSLPDKITKQAEKRGITYNWILNGCPDWAASEKALEIEKVTGQALWQSAPKLSAWQNYCEALAEHYQGKKILWEIWNEPDWEFLAGDEEDYLTLLRTAGEAFRENDPESFVYAGGLAFSAGDYPTYSYAKDRTKLYRGYTTLLQEGLIDTYAYHIHGYFTSTGFSDPMEDLKEDLAEAGLSDKGLFNTECGSSDEVTSYMASTDMAKALWSRGHGDGMFVLFSFTNIMEDGTKWYILDDYLSPNATAVAYANMIALLGNSSFKGNISNREGLYADMYFDGEKTVIPVYGITDVRHTASVVLPEGATFEILDLYGNCVEKEKLIAEIAPYYIVVEGEIQIGDVGVTE